MEELQQEEAEVLASIYDGDDFFKSLDPVTYQYKMENLDEPHKSFVLEVSWPANYPDELPVINLSAFYNNHLIPEVKELIVSELIKQAEPFLGCAMTYTLFDYAKEHAAELTDAQPAQTQKCSEKEEKKPEAVAGIKVAKEQLTKAQKRRMANKLDNKGELPRGWNWIDVVKHLSQTGQSKSSSQT